MKLSNRHSFRFLIIAGYFLLASSAFSQVNWVETNGPNGGSMSKIIVDSADNYYVGTQSYGVFQSTNKGLTWKDISQGLQLDRIPVLICSSKSEVYAGTGGPWSSANTTVFRYNPTLLKWESLIKQNINFAVSDLCKTRKNTLLIAARGTYPLFRIDDGTTDSIRSSNIGIQQKSILSIAESNEGVLYLLAVGDSNGRSYGVYKSVDDGKNWISLFQTTGDSYFISFLRVFDISSDKPPIIYIGTGNPRYIFSSRDEGKTWDTTLFDGGIYDITHINDTLIVSTFNGNSGLVYFSYDTGRTWKPHVHGLTDPIVLSFTVTRDKDLLAATDDAGVYKLKRGDTNWTAITQGLPNTTVWAIATGVKDTVYVGTYHIGVSKSTNRGESWLQVNDGLETTLITSLVRTPSGALYAGTDAGVYVSFNDAKKWKKISGINSGVVIHKMLLTQKDFIYVCSYDSGNYRIRVGDTIASRLVNDLPGIIINSLTQIENGIYGLGSYLVYNFQYHRYVSLPGLFYSKGDSTGFTYINNEVDPSGIIGSLHDTLFAYGGLKRSIDHGRSWSALNYSFGGAIEILSTIFNQVIIAANGSGVALSNDNGANWGLINSGITNDSPLAIAQDSEGYVYIGFGEALKWVKGGGVFRSTKTSDKLGVKSSLSTSMPLQSDIVIDASNRYIPIEASDKKGISIFTIDGRRVSEVVGSAAQLDKLDFYNLPIKTGLYYVQGIKSGIKPLKILLIK